MYKKQKGEQLKNLTRNRGDNDCNTGEQQVLSYLVLVELHPVAPLRQVHGMNHLEHTLSSLDRDQVSRRKITNLAIAFTLKKPKANL